MVDQTVKEKEEENSPVRSSIIITTQEKHHTTAENHHTTVVEPPTTNGPAIVKAAAREEEKDDKEEEEVGGEKEEELHQNPNQQLHNNDDFLLVSPFSSPHHVQQCRYRRRRTDDEKEEQEQTDDPLLFELSLSNARKVSIVVRMITSTATSTTKSATKKKNDEEKLTTTEETCLFPRLLFLPKDSAVSSSSPRKHIKNKSNVMTAAYSPQELILVNPMAFGSSHDDRSRHSSSHNPKSSRIPAWATLQRARLVSQLLARQQLQSFPGTEDWIRSYRFSSIVWSTSSRSTSSSSSSSRNTSTTRTITEPTPLSSSSSSVSEPLVPDDVAAWERLCRALAGDVTRPVTAAAAARRTVISVDSGGFALKHTNHNDHDDNPPPSSSPTVSSSNRNRSSIIVFGSNSVVGSATTDKGIQSSTTCHNVHLEDSNPTLIVHRHGLLGLTAHHILNRTASDSRNSPPHHYHRPRRVTLSMLEIADEDLVWDLLKVNPFARENAVRIQHNAGDGSTGAHHHSNRFALDDDDDDDDNHNDTPNKNNKNKHRVMAAATLVGLEEIPIDSLHTLGEVVKRAFTMTLHAQRTKPRGTLVARLKVWDDDDVDDSRPAAPPKFSTVQFVDVAQLIPDENDDNINNTNRKSNCNRNRSRNLWRESSQKPRNARLRQSLTALGAILRQTLLNEAGNNQTVITYRQHTLTKILNQDISSLDARVVVLASLSPLTAHYTETVATLRFINSILTKPGDPLQSPFCSPNNQGDNLTKTTKSQSSAEDDCSLPSTSSFLVAGSQQHGELLRAVIADPRQRIAKLVKSNQQRESRNRFAFNHLVDGADMNSEIRYYLPTNYMEVDPGEAAKALRRRAPNAPQLGESSTMESDVDNDNCSDMSERSFPSFDARENGYGYSSEVDEDYIVDESSPLTLDTGSSYYASSDYHLHSKTGHEFDDEPQSIGSVPESHSDSMDRQQRNIIPTMSDEVDDETELTLSDHAQVAFRPAFAKKSQIMDRLHWLRDASGSPHHEKNNNLHPVCVRDDAQPFPSPPIDTTRPESESIIEPSSAHEHGHDDEALPQQLQEVRQQFDTEISSLQRELHVHDETVYALRDAIHRERLSSSGSSSRSRRIIQPREAQDDNDNDYDDDDDDVGVDVDHHEILKIAEEAIATQAEMEKKVIELGSELSNLRKEDSLLREQHRVTDEAYAQSQKALHDARKDVRTMQKENERLRHELTQAQTLRSKRELDLENQLHERENELERCIADANTLKDELTWVIANTNQAASVTLEAEKELSDLRTALEDANSSIQHMSDEVERLQAKERDTCTLNDALTRELEARIQISQNNDEATAAQRLEMEQELKLECAWAREEKDKAVAKSATLKRALIQFQDSTRSRVQTFVQHRSELQSLLEAALQENDVLTERNQQLCATINNKFSNSNNHHHAVEKQPHHPHHPHHMRTEESWLRRQRPSQSTPLTSTAAFSATITGEEQEETEDEWIPTGNHNAHVRRRKYRMQVSEADCDDNNFDMKMMTMMVARLAMAAKHSAEEKNAAEQRQCILVAPQAPEEKHSHLQTITTRSIDTMVELERRIRMLEEENHNHHVGVKDKDSFRRRRIWKGADTAVVSSTVKGDEEEDVEEEDIEELLESLKHRFRELERQRRTET